MNMTITRDKLKKMYEENIIMVKNTHIQNYVDQIKESIVRLNNKGEKNYTKYFYKEKEDIIKEVSRRLYEIFIDCEVTCYTSDESEGFSVPLGIENPRSSIDVTKRSLVKSTDDEYRIFIDWT